MNVPHIKTSNEFYKASYSGNYSYISMKHLTLFCTLCTIPYHQLDIWDALSQNYTLFKTQYIFSLDLDELSILLIEK